MRTQLLPLTEELFQNIYTDKKLRNQIAYAHGCYDSNTNFKYLKTCSYPIEYTVTQAQKDLALQEIERDKVEILSNLGNKLVFVGMGCDYKERYEGDVCNHRIRTEIQNTNGRNFFIEVGTWGSELTSIQHVIDRDLEIEYEIKRSEYYDLIKSNGGFSLNMNKDSELWQQYQHYQKQPYYWHKKEVWEGLKIKYTFENVINLVNMLFDCNFDTMEVDNYTLRTEFYKSISK